MKFSSLWYNYFLIKKKIQNFTTFIRISKLNIKYIAILNNWEYDNFTQTKKIFEKINFTF